MPTKFGALRIESFDPERHQKNDFDCGVERLDNYLKLTAKKQQKADMTRVYVAIADGDTHILGYHAINLGVMETGELASPPRGAPKHGKLPVLFLGQVAVTKAAQGHMIGSILMHHAFEKAYAIAEQAGCYAIVLDVMDDGGPDAYERRLNWYLTFGFQPFSSAPARLFMTMAQVRALVDTRASR